MKKILTLICTLLCANVLLAQTRFYVGDLQYEVTSTNPAEVMVYWYQNNPTTVNIPETVSCEGTTYSVTAIDDSAFYCCVSLTSVTIPNSVTSIGTNAFYYCQSLTSVTLPNNATIDESAFAYAGPFSQNDITIDNIKYRTKRTNGIIGNYTFNNVGDITFYLNGNTYNLIFNNVEVYQYQNNPTIVNIPETVSYNGTTYSVTSIGEDAFSNCSSLTSVTIPNSVTSIEDGAFRNCWSLTSVTIPNNVTYIGNSAFNGCSDLTSVTLPNNATIKSSAFYNAGPFSVIYITIDNIKYRTKRTKGIIGNYTFNNVGDITFYLNGNTYNLRSVMVDRFQNNNPTIVNIPETINYNGATYNVTEIDDLAFNNCSSLTSITIPNSVTYIGGGVFYGCYNLTSVTLSNNIVTLKKYYNSDSGNHYGFFEGCSSLTSVTIPNSVTSIEARAFCGCSSLSSITIPNSVTSIGNNAFNGCSDLTSVTIPDSVTAIYEYTFKNCSSLTSITIPNSVTSIGNSAFFGCTALQNITLGESVASIGSGAFSSSSFLQNVTCLATIPPTIADNTVFPYPNIATLTVPCGSLEAYSAPTSFWNMFFMGRISEDGYEVVANVNNDAFGSVAIENNCSTATLTANANACYQFVGWNDGNTENPRLVTLSSDTTLTANFEVIVVNNDITATICEGQVYNENGFNVSEAGTYTQTLQTANGCDSIVTLVVTTYPTFDTTITATINAGEMYSEFGFNESEAGTYVQNLQTEFGCDSTITLILDVNSSLMDVVDTELSFFPNPTKSEITFRQAIEKVEVIDLTGKTIFTFSNAREINIESLPSGAYYLRLTNNDKAIMRKVIKE